MQRTSAACDGLPCTCVGGLQLMYTSLAAFSSSNRLMREAPSPALAGSASHQGHGSCQDVTASSSSSIIVHPILLETPVNPHDGSTTVCKLQQNCSEEESVTGLSDAAAICSTESFRSTASIYCAAINLYPALISRCCKCVLIPASVIPAMHTNLGDEQ